MNAKAFFDTNVLIYVVAQDAVRTAPAEALLAAGGLISVQILNEMASVARRKLGMSWKEVTEVLAAVRTLCPSPAPLTIETHEDALRIAAQYGYRIYDALVAATALENDCSTLYTEDLQDGQVIDGRLTIRNPFEASSTQR